MNQLESSYSSTAREAAEARFAHSIVACLAERAQNVSPDVGERLRFGRERALEAARRLRAADAPRPVGSTASGVAVLGFSRSRWWLPLASALPLVALVAGLGLIQDWQASTQISVAAEVDAALLSDDLPINAYRDPGFAEFLKAPGSE